jgi:hypothetical protein
LPPAAFAASIKAADDRMWIPGVLVDHLQDGGRFDEIAQAVAAQQQRVAGIETDFVKIDELRIVRSVRL